MAYPASYPATYDAATASSSGTSAGYPAIYPAAYDVAVVVTPPPSGGSTGTYVGYADAYLDVYRLDGAVITPPVDPGGGTGGDPGTGTGGGTGGGTDPGTGTGGTPPAGGGYDGTGGGYIPPAPVVLIPVDVWHFTVPPTESALGVDALGRFFHYWLPQSLLRFGETWELVQCPDMDTLATTDEYYQGGIDYLISADKAAELTAAGFGAGVSKEIKYV